jgi:hypothetical protein
MRDLMDCLTHVHTWRGVAIVNTDLIFFKAHLYILNIVIHVAV